MILDNKRPSIDYDGNKKYTLDEAIYLTGELTLILDRCSDFISKFILPVHCTCIGKGRFNVLIVFLSGSVIMGATIENISIAFVLPYANCDLNMTTTELGLVSSIAFFGIVISSHFWGFVHTSIQICLK